MVDMGKARPVNDIVTVISEHVALTQTGTSYQGTCPFHNGPGFHVIPGLGTYHCFDCKASGDVFRFIMEHKRLTFPEAMQYLTERADASDR